MKAQKGSRSVALLILKLGARYGCVGQRHDLAALPPKKSTALTVQEAGWATGPVWTGVKKRKYLAPSGIRVLKHPSRSDLLYRLPYPGPHNIKMQLIILEFECVDRILVAQVRDRRRDLKTVMKIVFP
jgi:hypothetical protein